MAACLAWPSAQPFNSGARGTLRRSREVTHQWLPDVTRRSL
jgi:hypothetical protein